MKFATYNIQFGIGLDGRLDPARIARAVEEADIICLQEVTRHFGRNGGIDLVAEMEALLPNHFSAFGAGCDTDAGSAIVDGRTVSKRFQFGNMVLSRWPIQAVRNLLLPRNRTYDRLNLQRSALECVIATPIGVIRVMSVHLDHLSPDERIAQIRFLRDRAFLYPVEGGAVTGAGEFGLPDPEMAEDFILMGDFNLMPDSPEYREATGLSDVFYGRTLRAGRFCDLLGHFGRTGPDSWSWTEPGKPEIRQLLDYCFASPALASRFVDGWIDNDADGSDHMPVWVVLE